MASSAPHDCSHPNFVSLYLDAYRVSRSDRDAEATRLAMTPWPNGAYYITTVAPQRSTRVRPKLKRVKKAAPRAKLGTQSTPTDQQRQQDANPADSPITPTVNGEDKLARIKKDAMRDRLEKAFANLKAKVEGAELEFYTPAYKFVLAKISNRMWNTRGECATTEQDIANNILWDVSKNVEKIEDIYWYLSKAAYKQGGKAFTDNNEDRDMHLPLIVETEEEDGETYKEDNPLLHLNELRPIFQRELPAFIEGDNLKICNYIREGHSYARIAEIMCTTVAAVKQRVAWMRNKIEEMQARGEKV